jgi:signal transduction histidine kinase
MRERALLLGGTVEILGTEGQGTVVSVNMPISKSRRSKERRIDAAPDGRRPAQQRRKAQ